MSVQVALRLARVRVSARAVVGHVGWRQPVRLGGKQVVGGAQIRLPSGEREGEREVKAGWGRGLPQKRECETFFAHSSCSINMVGKKGRTGCRPLQVCMVNRKILV